MQEFYLVPHKEPLVYHLMPKHRPKPQPLPKAAAARGRRPRGQPVLVPLVECKNAASRARRTAKADITAQLEAQMRVHNVRHAKTKASSPLLLLLSLFPPLPALLQRTT